MRRSEADVRAHRSARVAGSTRGRPALVLVPAFTMLVVVWIVGRSRGVICVARTGSRASPEGRERVPEAVNIRPQRPGGCALTCSFRVFCRAHEDRRPKATPEAARGLSISKTQPSSVGSL